MANYQSLKGAATIAAVLAASATGAVTLVGYGTQGTGPVMRAISADQTALVNGTAATGKVNMATSPSDNDKLVVGGQTFTTRAHYANDAAVPFISCMDGGCAASPATAQAVATVLAAQGDTNTVAVTGRDGGIVYLASKIAGIAGNVPISGAVAGASTGMSGGKDPATKGGPTTGYVANSFNPSVSGLIAPVGSIVRTIDETKAWMKMGIDNTNWDILSSISSHD